MLDSAFHASADTWSRFSLTWPATRKGSLGEGTRQGWRRAGMMALFRESKLEELLNVRPDWLGDIRLGQRGKEAVLFIRVAPVNPFEEFQPQKHAVEEALRTAYRLPPYGRILHNTAAVP